MAQSFSTTIGLTANASSTGQPVDFDGAAIGDLVISNGSGVDVQYTLDGSTWVTVSSGATAAPVVQTPASFRLRKSTSDSYPVPVSLVWRAVEDYASKLASSSIWLPRSPVVSAGRPLTIIPAGDSITASSSTYSAGLWQFGTGYAEASILQSGGKFRLLRNAGVAGNTSAQLLARLQSDVIAYAPDVCLLMIGTNDLLSGMSNAAMASVFNNIEQIVLRLLNARILPVLVTPPPKDGAITETKNAQWFYYALAQHYGLPLIDVFRVLVNPQTGAFASGNSSDGTHPSNAGITKMIAQAGTVLSSLSASVCAPYLAAVGETSANNFANLLRNGNFAHVTASPTPDSWTVNATNATQTIPAVTAGTYTGNTFTYNKTGAGAAYALSGAAPTVASGGFSAGDVLRMNVRLKVTGLTPSTASGFTLSLDASSGGGARLASNVQNGDYLFSTELTVPAGATYLAPTLYVQDVAQFEVNNWTLFNVTKANAIWRPGQQSI